jgi:hypothetical protein
MAPNLCRSSSRRSYPIHGPCVHMVWPNIQTTKSTLMFPRLRIQRDAFISFPRFASTGGGRVVISLIQLRSTTGSALVSKVSGLCVPTADRGVADSPTRPVQFFSIGHWAFSCPRLLHLIGTWLAMYCQDQHACYLRWRIVVFYGDVPPVGDTNSLWRGVSPPCTAYLSFSNHLWLVS